MIKKPRFFMMAAACAAIFCDVCCVDEILALPDAYSITTKESADKHLNTVRYGVGTVNYNLNSPNKKLFLNPKERKNISEKSIELLEKTEEYCSMFSPKDDMDASPENYGTKQAEMSKSWLCLKSIFSKLPDKAKKAISKAPNKEMGADEMSVDEIIPDEMNADIYLFDKKNDLWYTRKQKINHHRKDNEKNSHAKDKRRNAIKKEHKMKKKKRDQKDILVVITY
jgi:hypothetical protein